MKSPSITGADRVIEWFGDWPDLHDARIDELQLRSSSESRVVISAFEYRSETDARGFLKTTNACRVSFIFSNATDLKLESESGVGTIIFETKWTEDDRGITFAWQSSVGFDGSIRARNWRVEIEPIDAPE
jgi:immunity protein 50 of polymorphic toxin system